MIVERKIKRGSKNDTRDVMLVQHVLGGLAVDGDYGAKSEAKVRELQKELGLDVTGVVGDKEWIYLLEDYDELDLRLHHEVSWSYDHINFSDRKHKPFKEQKSKKDMAMLHHTVSGANPFAVSDYFSTKGFATQFILGGDGTIVQTAPLDWWCLHINVREDFPISREQEHRLAMRCIGIEICCWGALDERDGKLYNTYGGEVDMSSCIKYDEPFRGKVWFHKYTDKQIAALRVLLKALQSKGYLKKDVGVTYDRSWLDTINVPEVIEGKKGLVSHTHVRQTKSDIHPQPEMLAMLQELV